MHAQPSDYRAIVEAAIARVDGDLTTEAGAHAFTQKVVDILVCQDPRWGRKSTNGGPLSADTVAYRLGDLTSDGRNTSMRVLDYCISCGAPSAHLGWIDYGIINDQRFIPVSTSHCGGTIPTPPSDESSALLEILKLVIENQNRQIQLLEDQLKTQVAQTESLRVAIADLKAEIAKGVLIRFR